MEEGHKKNLQWESQIRQRFVRQDSPSGALLSACMRLGEVALLHRTDGDVCKCVTTGGSR